MKYTLLFLVLLALPERSFIKVYEGQIGSHPILLKLINDEGNVTGTYHYIDELLSLELSGQLDGQNLLLEERTKKGKLTGVFSGVLTDGKYAGTWSTPNESESFDFSMIETSQTYSYKPNGNNIGGLHGSGGSEHILPSQLVDQVEVDPVLDDLDKNGISYSKVIGKGGLRIVRDGSRLKFSIDSRSTFLNCTKNVYGVATFTEDRFAVFRSPACNLTFMFRNNRIVVEETNCKQDGNDCPIYGVFQLL